MELILYFQLIIILVMVLYNINKINKYNYGIFAFIGVTFPGILSVLKLSNLQVDKWEFETILLIFIYNILFVMLPLMIDIFKNHKKNKVYFKDIIDDLYKIFNGRILDIMLTLNILLLLISNKILTGNYINIAKSVNVDFHSSYIPGISLLISIIMIPSLYFSSIYIKKLKGIKKILRVLLILLNSAILILKGTRSDLAIVFSMILITYLCVEKLKFKKICKIGIYSIFIFVIFWQVQMSRTTDYGKIKKSWYAQSIGMKNTNRFDEVLANYYGYTSLSFENLNLSIRNWTGEHYKGHILFNSIFNIFQLDNIIGKEYHSYKQIDRDQRRRYLLPQANRTSQLYDYYADGGIIGGILEMFLISLIMFNLYLNIDKKKVLFPIYIFFVSTLSYCQVNLIMNGQLVYWLVYYVFLIVIYSIKNNILNKDNSIKVIFNKK